MNSTLFGITTDTRLVHLKNAHRAILVSPSGIRMCVAPLPLHSLQFEHSTRCNPLDVVGANVVVLVVIDGFHNSPFILSPGIFKSIPILFNSLALTKSLGKELANKNIAVNAVTPAGAKTRILNQMSKEHVKRMLSKVPRARFLKLNELSSMVCWLSSEENSFSTAAVFDISGGRSTY